MITNNLAMYGSVVQAVMEKLLIVWTCHMLVEFLNTTYSMKLLELHAHSLLELCVPVLTEGPKGL